MRFQAFINASVSMTHLAAGITCAWAMLLSTVGFSRFLSLAEIARTSS